MQRIAECGILRLSLYSTINSHDSVEAYRMPVLATIGASIRVTPWDDIQYWADEDTEWEFVDDRTPFDFRVEGELQRNQFFFGLYGPVIAGPERYHNLICSVILRSDDSDWTTAKECSANVRVAPTHAARDLEFDSNHDGGMPFYLHPEVTFVEGYPRVSRFGGICIV